MNMSPSRGDINWQSEIPRLSDEYAQKEKALLEELFHFLRFESISADPTRKENVRSCAMWVKEFLAEAGFSTAVWETQGHPVIFAEWCKAGPDAPTVLIYNHYDVQPVDPLELWQSPPFEPTIRAGEIFARGAQDNKGQCFSVMSSLRHLLKRDGALPVNVKLVIEGEEETGSQGLASVLAERARELQADHLIVVDMGIPDPQTPSVTLGLRGMTAMTLELEGSSMDLHSGVYGGIVYNPNRAMVELLGKAFRADGSVAIPGFYDDVVPMPADERKTISFDFDVTVYERELNAKATGGEHAYKPLESAWARPTFEINGLSGGYSGAGFKTVIPAKAMAKLSCRLVPNQSPEKIAGLVKAFLERELPDGIRMTLTVHPGGGEALRTPASSPLVQATSEVYEQMFHRPTQRILCGGSVPVIPALARTAGSQVVLIGYGLDSDNMHAPNEHYGTDRVKKGFVTIGSLLFRLAKLKGGE